MESLQNCTMIDPGMPAETLTTPRITPEPTNPEYDWEQVHKTPSEEWEWAPAKVTESAEEVTAASARSKTEKIRQAVYKCGGPTQTDGSNTTTAMIEAELARAHPGEKFSRKRIQTVASALRRGCTRDNRRKAPQPPRQGSVSISGKEATLITEIAPRVGGMMALADKARRLAAAGVL